MKKLEIDEMTAVAGGFDWGGVACIGSIVLTVASGPTGGWATLGALALAASTCGAWYDSDSTAG